MTLLVCEENAIWISSCAIVIGISDAEAGLEVGEEELQTTIVNASL
jgi:hypothetical protein